MKYKTFIILLFIVVIVVLASCKDENEEEKPLPDTNPESETKEVNKPDEDEEVTDMEEDGNDVTTDLVFLEGIDEVPQDTSGVINQKQGKYAGIDIRDDSVEDQVIEDLNKLEPLPENASDEQLNAYFKYLYSLIAEDFPDPQDTIKKWEFGSFGDPNLPDSRFHFKENYNVEVLLDGSGSMGAYIGNQTMMEIAKETIHDFMKQVPEEATISLRVYGHKGTGSNSDKELSCSTIEQIYGYSPYEEKAFQEELDTIQPAGWTPLADSLEQAEEALQQFDTENNTNLIFVVSDGIETCDGDPVAVAKSLSDSNAKPIINIIGFNVDNEAQAQLKKMAEVSGGIFATANNQEELKEEFARAEEVIEAWDKWKNEAIKDLDAISVDNSFDIIEVTNEWNRKQSLQHNNIYRLSILLKEQGLVTHQQSKTIGNKRFDVRDIARKGNSDVEKELKDISVETIEELKLKINDKYDSGTQD